MDQSDKYKFYAASDFAGDEAFWLWIIEEDAEQAIFWTNFLKNNPAKKEEIEKARQLVLQLNTPGNQFAEEKVKQLWQKIENTRANLPQEQQANATIPLPRSRFSWFSMAAAITLLVVSAALGWFLLYKPTPIILATTYGERKEFRLPDGSQVLLNANSQVKYTDNWGTDQDREVWLTGEGFFEIQPKKNKQKFVVHAGNVYIKVLGTSFNVNNRRQEIKVLLNTGKISLGIPQATPLLLKPGDLVTYQEQSAQLNKTIVDPEAYLGWKNNLLQFKAESLENIFLLLQDQYNLNITTEDPAILQKKFTGTVPADNLSVLFTGLQEGYNLEIIQSGNNIRIKHKTEW